ncbi:tryptophan synthase subunit alpha [Bacillus sp. FJAT-45350]|uniref:tryptophan synthase subunit alpha n=1 Tax=Bacillus sp. FJAT-45350 TaxID=2011014 RepID=UPI00211CC4F9|nr:tryptophan synthase subunit alpha [Bacillus sp. FJAT-45350]
MSNPRFEACVKDQRNLFIPFIMAGDPHPDVTIELALILEEAGANVIELGIPYSDPLADGPVIQESAKRALANGTTLENAMGLVPKMRERGLTIPVVVFTYYNPLLQFGEERFIAEAAKYGVDGLLVPDLPHEESESLRQMCHDNQISYISLVAPTSNARIEMIASQAEGFLYCVSSLGVTGVRDHFDDKVYDFLSTVRKHSTAPIAVGFGISKREQVEALAPYCDGIIVGSAIIRLVEQNKELLINEKNRKEGLLKIKRYIESLISS